MAQPVVAFDKDDYGKESSDKSVDPDYFDVLESHKAQSESTAKCMSEAFRVLGEASLGKSKKHDKKPASPGTESAKENDAADDKNKPSTPALSPINSMPAYFPLLPPRCTDVCLHACRQMLGCGAQQSKGRDAPPPGVLQACLMLLLRLLRTPAASSDCIRHGIVEAVLALPAKSRFTGNSGLVTLILRRLLEDESTLLAAMETEIRTTMTKMAKKEHGTSANKTSSVLLRSFVETATPLLCRGPTAFLKAMSSTLKVVDPKASNPKITLLPLEERTTKKTATTTEGPSQSATGNAEPGGTPSKSKTRRSISGSRRRSSSTGRPRSSSKGRKSNSSNGGSDRNHKKEDTSAPATPASLITCNLVGQILVVGKSANKDDSCFLYQWELLGILSDLILAVPACAASVHNYRPHRNKDKLPRSHRMMQLVHALSDSPSPSKTFVNYLLHVVLVHDRWNLRYDENIWGRKREGVPESSSIKSKKKEAASVMKTSQAAARVLLALSARPGEGRKRVIADLAFALSAGRLGQSLPSDTKKSTTQTPPNTSKDTELHALHSWGELCLGLAVPRGGGKNLESAISINYEIVRIMFDHGMVHALMYAAHRVPLSHQMASGTLGTLLLPFELLTRSTVSNNVAELIKRESSSKDGASPGPISQDAPVVSEADGSGAQSFFMEAEESSSIEDDVEVMEVDDENDVDSDEESGDDENGDEEMSEDEQSEESDEISEESSSDDSSDGSDVDDDDQGEEIDEEGAWNLDYENAFGPENPQPNDDDEGDDNGDRANGEEGWTRIESSGFGGMMMGGFAGRMNNTQNGDGEGDRTRGFIDAAEAMIGTLLRSGEINQDSLAEIESQLGVRIMGGNNRRLRQLGVSAGADVGALGDAFRTMGGAPSQGSGRSVGDVMGTLPHVNQRTQPDAGYSAFGSASSGRLADLSSIEIVFGGPSVTSGSRNYDVNALRPSETDEEDEQLPHVTQLDLQLFPGGPSSAATPRTQHSLHPLLCGVDLPPINSLVMDLLPHGVRARRSGQINARRPGDWTNISSFSPGGYLVSTSTGNIIRSNRSHAGAPLGAGLQTRNVSGPIGWTDDGLPFDATVEGLGTTLRSELTRSLQEQAEAAAAEEALIRAAAPASASAENPSSSDGPEQSMPTTEESQGHATDLPSPAAPERDDDAPSMGSEGERVASSLASGLRLSPSADGVEATGAEPSMGAADQEVDGNPVPSNGTTDNEMPTETTEGDEQPVESMEEDIPEAEEQQETSNVEESEVEPSVAEAEQQEAVPTQEQPESNADSEDTLVCPPGVDPEAFRALPREMQLDVVREHSQSSELAAELDGSTLDPEFLAALPEDMRREVIEQERRERSRETEEAAPADPSLAADMDNASFIATLPPELRAEVLATADDETLNSLPPNLIAEANVLRERAAEQRQRAAEADQARNLAAEQRRGAARAAPSEAASNTRKKPRTGKLKVEANREDLIYTPEGMSQPLAKCDLQLILQLFFLLSPVRPQRLLQKILQNFCSKPELRAVLSTALLQLLHENKTGVVSAVDEYAKVYPQESNNWRAEMDSLFSSERSFPPDALLGLAPEIPQANELDNFSAHFQKLKQGLGAAASVAANLPKSSRGSNGSSELPPVVASRLLDSLQQLCKSSPRFCVHSLASNLVPARSGEASVTCLESMMDLLQRPHYLRGPARLEQLLALLETVVAPLSYLPRGADEDDPIPQRELDAAAAAGKEWAEIPCTVISHERLQALCSILRMEACRDTAFARVNTVLRRLCRVESNRRHVLAELASVAHSLGEDAIHDLKALKIRMTEAASQREVIAEEDKDTREGIETKPTEANGKLSSSVTFSTSTSELKLLRVLQTLQAMCSDTSDESHGKKDNFYVTEELIHLLRQLDFGALWDELSSCLKIVQVLEGVSTSEEAEKSSEDADGPEEVSGDDDAPDTPGKKKLRNSSAGLLTRFLPSIEAFFVATASATRPKDSEKASSSSPHESSLENIVGANRLVDFVSENKILLNALVRNNPGLLDRGMKALVQVPRCRAVLDFDVKRQWFKTQVRRLRQHASRRHGNIRLHINRKNVFEEAYHQLRLRNADEMRGRLHITFRDEDGIDAGGLSREFFAILGKEMFNPNYALFTSTEDGCTFQPNPNSAINPDHLSYFRFCGRIVGKAVADGYLLDAHFTRSLYKHMLGIKPSHGDMEAIDPDYYRNLKTILDYNLEDIGLELFFSVDENSFGRSKVIDLIPNGRKIPVTESNKEEYVQLVCENRMTTAIQRQIKAYLDGFYELVSPDLIAIFTPRELELVISGLPDIDVADLKKNTDYVGWKATDKEIGWFWAVLGSLTRNQKAEFLQFVTGSSKVPLAGFGELLGMRGIQKFSIHKVTNNTKGALMSAHTCFNSLDLPMYSSEEETREKLLYAINEGGGGFMFA